MSRSPRLLALLLCGFAVLAVGCSGQRAAVQECRDVAADPAGCTYSALANQLDAAQATKAGIMEAVGNAFRDGLITLDQREQARAIGKQFEAAWDAAQKALATARTLGGPAPLGVFDDVEDILTKIRALSEAF